MLKDKKLFLFDVEGVLVESIDEPKPIPNSINLVKKLIEEGKEIIVLTNISRRSRKYVYSKLKDAGFPFKLDDVVTAGKVAAEILRKEGLSCFVISEGGLYEDLVEMGINIRFDGNVDAVVVGANRKVTYSELNHAMRLLLNGAKLICSSTSKKFAGSYLGDKGYFLGEAAITEALSFATGVKPRYIGKPYKEIFEVALNLKGVNASEAVMIGDSIESDIIGASNAKILPILVSHGKDVSLPKEINGLVIKDLYELYSLIFG